MFEFEPPEQRRPLPPEFLARVTEHIDPTFGMLKQKKVDSWTPDVRRREAALFRDVYALEAEAMRHIARALAAT